MPRPIRRAPSSWRPGRNQANAGEGEPAPKGGQDQGRAGEKQPAPPEGSKTFLVVFGEYGLRGQQLFNLFGNGDLFLNTTNFWPRPWSRLRCGGG